MLCPIFIHTAISLPGPFSTQKPLQLTSTSPTLPYPHPHPNLLYITMAHHPESDDQFNTLLTENADKLVIVDFFATWYVIP